ncbi:MAG: GH3 auxin-responsive promoter family protein [Alistipes sp.]|nr:GH3 auxin-responsive promoter family protein [Alistipes sp.]
MSVKERVLKNLFSHRLHAIDKWRDDPRQVQRDTLRAILHGARSTEFALRHGLTADCSAEEFRRRVEPTDYDSYGYYIDRMMSGAKMVACRGRVDMFARSSGTTSSRSKYIPLTHKAQWNCHLRGMSDVVTLYLAGNPSSQMFRGRTLTLGGSCSREQGYLVGDLSGLLLHNTRYAAALRRPSMKTALTDNFDIKCEAIVRECVGCDIRAFAGVPSWNLALMRRVLEATGKADICQVWPGMELFMHGGVSFAPYRKAFEELIPSDNMHYVETYNASEGFFAIADDSGRDDMLLMMDYGIYYEFRRGDEVLSLEEVVEGEEYAPVITTCGGLWRYEIGDVVRVTSVKPYRVKVVGRTRQYINVFGEEVVAENAERALMEACRECDCRVEEYSVAPRYMTISQPGAHEWYVEFGCRPDDPVRFAGVLDEALRRINSDYDAKRRSTLSAAEVIEVPRGGFERWLKECGRNKVPRLSNDRRVAESLGRYL